MSILTNSTFCKILGLNTEVLQRIRGKLDFFIKLDTNEILYKLVSAKKNELVNHFKVDFKDSVSSIYNRFLQRIVANVGEAKWSPGEEFDLSVGRK